MQIEIEIFCDKYCVIKGTEFRWPGIIPSGGILQLEHEDGHSLPSSDEVNKY